MTDTEIKKQSIELENEISGERDRISTDRMDISFGELISLYKNKELIISPDYQRLFRWSLEQQTALIESLLLSIPIPPIFVSEDKNGVWELVDGLQRVSTFLSFFGEFDEIDELDEVKNENIDILEDCVEVDDFENQKNRNNKAKNRWELLEGDLVKNLKGFNIDNFPTKFKLNLKRAVCRVEILKGKNSAEMKYELFKRLNAGGTTLTPQEIRNAIFRMKNPTIIKAIIELSSNELFKKYTNLSKQKIEELYNQELVLRFFAYYNNIDEINENTENFLNSFLDRAVSNESFDIEFYKATFLEVLELIDKINDEKIFKNTKNLFVPSLFEGICVALAQNIDLYRGNIAKLKVKVNELKLDETFKKFSGSASNSKTRSKYRLARANEIFSEA